MLSCTLKTLISKWKEHQLFVKRGNVITALKSRFKNFYYLPCYWIFVSFIEMLDMVLKDLALELFYCLHEIFIIAEVNWFEILRDNEYAS